MTSLRPVTRTLAAVCMLGLAATAAPVALADHVPAPPAVYAHRGGAAEAPENTLGAFAQAWERYESRGVVLEMDLWLAADGVLVVHHDATLDRTTDCRGSIVAKTSVELAACDAATTWADHGFEKVPTFAEVLEAGRDADVTWRIMPELKGIPGDPGFDPSGVAPARAIVDALSAADYPFDSVVVQSFWPAALDAVDALLAVQGLEIDTALLTSSALVASPQLGFTAHQNVAYATARGYEVSAPREDSADLGPATAAHVVAAAHAAGRRVIPYTIDDPDRLRELAAAGVDGVITNSPGIAYRTLDALGV